MSDSSHASNGSSTNAERLAALLDASGVTDEELKQALEALAIERRIKPPVPERKGAVYLDKELIYDDENAFIYRRNDTKKKYYQIRIWDKRSRKPFVKSLGTADRSAAIVAARQIYVEISGKIKRGEKLKSVTNKELFHEYWRRQEQLVTPIPKAGITPSRFRVKKYYGRLWLEYIDFLGLGNTPIDRIPSNEVSSFGAWLLQKPKEKNGDTSPRSLELINNCISEINLVFRKVAVKDKWIGINEVPDIERMTAPPTGVNKRDILSPEEYKELRGYMLKHYVLGDKKADEEERLKRQIFYFFIQIMYNTGMRCKEILGLRVSEVRENPSPLDVEEAKAMGHTEVKEMMLVDIRASNSKTGYPRTIAAPIRSMYESVIALQNSLGSELRGDDFLFMNPASKTRKSYTREILARRLKTCLISSGLQDKFEMDGRKINLYSARHAWFSWRLRYGSVPLQLLAKAGGNSVPIIMKTYGHIQIEKEALKLMKGQFRMQNPDADELMSALPGEDKSLYVVEKMLKLDDLEPEKRKKLESVRDSIKSSKEWMAEVKKGSPKL